MSWWAIVLCVAAAGVVAAVVWQFVVARWPEPELAGEEKVSYASLGRGRRWAGVGLAGAGVATVVCLTFPVHAVPAGLVLATLGVVLAGCDAWTTWIPARLCHVGWVLVAAAAAVSVVLPGGGSAVGALVALGCGAVTFGAFALLWWRGLCGFSDARFVVLLAVTGGLVGVTAAAAGIAVGCVVAAAHSVVLRRGGHGFVPWAPGLLLGALIGISGFALLG